jgi:glutathione S-transferase
MTLKQFLFDRTNKKSRSSPVQQTNLQEEWFLKINPNGRIPAILDRSTTPPTRVFESCAVLQYIVDKYDKEGKASYSREEDPDKYYEQLGWLFFQAAGVGPMQGQAICITFLKIHAYMIDFLHYASEKIPYAINHYQSEARRLYSVLDARLRENGGYLVGDHVTIGRISLKLFLMVADIANFGWVDSYARAGLDIEEFPSVKAWLEKLKARPGFLAGLNVPKEN